METANILATTNSKHVIRRKTMYTREFTKAAAMKYCAVWHRNVKHLQMLRGSIVSFPFIVALQSFCRWHGLPSLRPHVLNIISSCANPEMVRSHAGWVIAAMKHPFTLRNWSDIQCIREPMSGHRFAVYDKFSITKFVGSTVPYPASIRFHYFNPKAFFYGHGRMIADLQA